MDRDDWRAIAVVAACLLVMTLFAYLSAPRAPRCEEDQVVVGAGDFQNGYWDRYECRSVES